MKQKKKFNKKMFKLDSEDVQGWNLFMRRGSVIENKKGKGSFKRKPKHSIKFDD